MSRYRLSPLAGTDLDQIWQYTAREGGVESAERQNGQIIACFPMLARMPKLGRRRLDIGPGFRSFPIGNYLIYYYEGRRPGIVIARVIHAKRDQKTAF